ncbi:UNVERIFIED_CONTAM: hypothetical protein Slati_2703600 [Sesamum latifolium]|uniref:Uncharacterized protein n=1 Tax=Sesamum latifolium TaxID=2727402 RepID=A0AAW2VWL8_9LAMI
MDPTGHWLNHCWAALAKVVKKTRYLIPLVYLCKRVVFSKRERCSRGSVMPSYSTITGLQKFARSSFAITASVKQTWTPCLSSSGASSGTGHPRGLSEGTRNRQALWKDLLRSQQGSPCLLFAGATGTGMSPSASSLGASTSDGVVTRAGGKPPLAFELLLRLSAG